MAGRRSHNSRGRARGTTEIFDRLQVDPPVTGAQGAIDTEDEQKFVVAAQVLCTALPEIRRGQVSQDDLAWANNQSAVEDKMLFSKAIAPNVALACTASSSIRDGSKARIRDLEDDLLSGTKGSSGIDEEVITNYFIVNKSPGFVLNGYRVDFEPAEIDDTRLKRQLMHAHKATLGNFMFDGHTLYTGTTIPKHLETLESVNATNQQKFKITLRLVSQIRPDDKVYLQFHNIAFRSMLEKIGMEQIGRHYYDRKKAISMEEERLDLWPGVTTSIREHEAGMLLCVELTHKILRRETAFDVMSSVVKNIMERSRGRNFKPDVNGEILNELLNCVVLTHYNRRTYRIDDIDFNKTPQSEFTLDNGTPVTYVKYYKDRWNIDLSGDDLTQPLLVSNPRRKDLNKGVNDPIYLIPSLCYMTGLTENMRKNFNLTKKLSVHLHMPPGERKKKLDEFIQQFSCPKIKEEFNKWKFEFGTNFVSAPVRILPHEPIHLRGQNQGADDWFVPDKSEDWSLHFRKAGLLDPVEIKNWVMFASFNEHESCVREFISTLLKVGKRLGCRMVEPNLIRYDSRARFSMEYFMKAVHKFAKGLQMVLYILPSGVLGTRYNDVKKACTLELKVVSQCFQSRNLRNRNLIAICQKMLIQINAKLRGEPWAVKIPISNSMVLGFDVFRCSARKEDYVAALVASVNKNCTHYFSTVSFHSEKTQLAGGLNASLLKCLDAYMEVNKKLPNRIILFRDSVGDGQIDQVLGAEVSEMQMRIRRFYEDHGRQDEVRLAVIIVTKKINTRYLKQEQGTWANPCPGTILDSEVTLPDRYDFFLVSQTVRQGTVSPTNYNVLHDTSGISADHLQILTYKLCHLYFNGSGSVAVPAPCQYAHKLAQLTGSVLAKEAPPNLCHNLWYL